MAEGDRPQDVVLASFGLSDLEWLEAQVVWNRALAEDEVADGELASAFGSHFAAAQDALKPVPELTPEQWAAAEDDVAEHGMAGLKEHRLSEGDFARLKRRWAATMAADRSAAERYRAALFARHPVDGA